MAVSSQVDVTETPIEFRRAASNAEAIGAVIRGAAPRTWLTSRLLSPHTRGASRSRPRWRRCSRMRTSGSLRTRPTIPATTRTPANPTSQVATQHQPQGPELLHRRGCVSRHDHARGGGEGDHAGTAERRRRRQRAPRHPILKQEVHGPPPQQGRHEDAHDESEHLQRHQVVAVADPVDQRAHKREDFQPEEPAQQPHQRPPTTGQPADVRPLPHPLVRALQRPREAAGQKTVTRAPIHPICTRALST